MFHHFFALICVTYCLYFHSNANFTHKIFSFRHKSLISFFFIQNLFIHFIYSQNHNSNRFQFSYQTTITSHALTIVIHDNMQMVFDGIQYSKFKWWKLRSIILCQQTFDCNIRKTIFSILMKLDGCNTWVQPFLIENLKLWTSTHASDRK